MSSGSRRPPTPSSTGASCFPTTRYAAWAEERRRALHARYLEALRAAGRWEELAAEDPADEPAGLARDAGAVRGRRPAAVRCGPSSG